MTIILDSGVLIAYLHERDNHHAEARRIMERVGRGEFGLPLIVDHVIDEAVTFLRARVGRRDVSQRLLSLVYGEENRPIGDLLATSLDDLREAIQIHMKFFDRGLSLTDSILIVHTTAARGVLATFEKGFEGIVSTASA